LVHRFLNKFAAKRLPPHLHNVFTLCLVKLEMLIAQIIPPQLCPSNFAEFESSW